MAQKGNRVTDSWIFKVVMFIIGAFLSCFFWIGQTYVSSLSEGDKNMHQEIKSQGKAIQEIDKRVTRIEVLVPEIRDSLKEIKTDVKRLFK